MLNQANDSDTHAVMIEAASRVRYVIEALQRAEDDPFDAEQFNGFDLSIMREILEDVADTLGSATIGDEPTVTGKATAPKKRKAAR